MYIKIGFGVTKPHSCALVTVSTKRYMIGLDTLIKGCSLLFNCGLLLFTARRMESALIWILITTLIFLPCVRSRCGLPIFDDGCQQIIVLVV